MGYLFDKIMDTNIDEVKMNNVAYGVSKVYELVTQSLLFYCLGMFIGYNFIVPFMHLFVTIFTFVSVFAFVLSGNDSSKWFWMNSVAVSLGIISGPVIAIAYELDPLILPTAAVSTTAIFAFFTYHAKNIRDENMNYMGSFLYSSLLASTIVGFVMLFFRVSQFVQLVYLGLGLVMFCGFISYDTKLMYDRFKKGETNYYDYAMNLFLDIINVFIKILNILMILSGKKKDNKKDKQ